MPARIRTIVLSSLLWAYPRAAPPVLWLVLLKGQLESQGSGGEHVHWFALPVSSQAPRADISASCSSPGILSSLCLLESRADQLKGTEESACPEPGGETPAWGVPKAEPDSPGVSQQVGSPSPDSQPSALLGPFRAAQLDPVMRTKGQELGHHPESGCRGLAERFYRQSDSRSKDLKCLNDTMAFRMRILRGGNGEELQGGAHGGERTNEKGMKETILGMISLPLLASSRSTE